MTERYQRIETLLAEFGDVHQRIRRDRPADFNVLRLFHVHRDEVSHTRILRLLLDQRSAHAEGPVLLGAFMEASGIPPLLNPMRDYEVWEEYRKQEATVDIAVWQPQGFIIYIENKLFSPEGPEQIDRELRDMARLGDDSGVPTERQFAVFLTPYGKAVNGDPSRCRSVSSLRLASRFCERLPVVREHDPKLSFLLEDWIATIRRLGV